MFILGLVVALFVGWFLYERRRRPTHSVRAGLHEELSLPHTQEWELYHNQLSICSKKLRICLAELQLPYASHHVDLIETGSYGNLSREFLKVNPGFTVPVLVHNGHPIYESHEQIVYAAEQCGEVGASLLGYTAGVQEEVARWIDGTAIKGDPLQGSGGRVGGVAPGLTIPIFVTMMQYIPWRRVSEGLLFHGDRRRPLMFAVMKLRGLRKLPAPVVAIIQRSRRQMSEHLAELENELADGRTWVCGEAFTLGDVGWMALFDRLDEVDWSDLFLGEGKLPRVRAYWERLMERPSYAAALEYRGEIHVRALEDLRELKRSFPELRKQLELS